MEPCREAVYFGTAELKKLQEALKARSPDASSNLSATKSHLARINVWAVSVGLADSPNSELTSHWPNVSLPIQAQVRSLLDDLVHVCREATNVALGQHSHHIDQARENIDQALLEYFAPQDLESTTEKSFSDELAGILSDIEDIIDCLSSLTPSIRNGTGPKLTFNTYPTSMEPKSHLDRDTQLVRTSFPTIEPIIADRLLMAISWRRNLIASWQSPPPLVNDPDKTRLGVEEPINIEPRYCEAKDLQAQAAISRPSPEDRESSRRASLNDQEPKSSQAQLERTVDVASIFGSRTAEPAHCPLCCVVQVVDGVSWNEHISKDLRPYICLVEACTDPQNAFMYHGDWISHMVQKHWKSWNCPFCPSIECPSPAILQDHVSTQHPNEVPSGKLDSFISLCATSEFSRCKRTCPLCSVFNIETSDQYRTHISQHLEQLTAVVFSDILGQVESGETEASINHSSTSHHQPGKVGPSPTKHSPPVTTTKTTLQSPEGKGSSVSSLSDQLKSVSISRPTPERLQKSDVDMGSSAVDRTHQPWSEAITSAGASSLLEASASSDSLHASEPISRTLVTEPSGVINPSLGTSTRSLLPQTSQSLSHIGRIAGQRSYGGRQVIYLWSCCYCGAGGMNTYTTPACTRCGVARCRNCQVEAHKVRR